MRRSMLVLTRRATRWRGPGGTEWRRVASSQCATSNDVDFGLRVVASVAVLAEALLAPTLQASHGLPLAIEIPVSPGCQSDLVVRPAPTIACVAKRSRRSASSHDRCPSEAIVPMRRPWLPNHASAAGPSMTIFACKTASSAISASAQPLSQASHGRSAAHRRPDRECISPDGLPRPFLRRSEVGERKRAGSSSATSPFDAYRRFSRLTSVRRRDRAERPRRWGRSRSTVVGRRCSGRRRALP